MNILFVTSEAVPFSKTGGLADVCGSLPCALAAAGEAVSLIVPLYRSTAEKFRDAMEFVCYFYVRLAWRNLYCGIFKMQRGGVTWYFVDNEQYFKREELYGYYDDGERFAYFSRAVTEFLPRLKWRPDVVHCNDWQSALVPIYIRDEAVRNDFYKPIRTVLTVHNVEYQGRFGAHVLGDLLGLDEGWMVSGTLDYEGDVNLLKGAILTADAVTAVSPTYAQELKTAEYAHGLQEVIASRGDRMQGVLNGIDTERYDPEKDTLLHANYSAQRMEGKAEDKAYLQQKTGLCVEKDRPLIAMVTRLVSHKGLDLVVEAMDDILARSDAQFVILGRGEERYERFFHDACARHSGRVAFCCGYSEGLAMDIYAGADLFLMPSRSEPCGLSQMIAMRYGTVPIVRETGGLRDTVHAYQAWCGEGDGFTFAAYNAHDMAHVVCEAVELYHSDSERFALLRRRDMELDLSWDASARRYRSIYAALCGDL